MKMVKREVSQGIIWLISHKQFYGHLLQQLVKVFLPPDAELDTMGVGKSEDEMLVKLYVNCGFVEGLHRTANSEDQAWKWLIGVLEHEVLHIVLGHLSMAFDDKDRAAISFDLAVNSYIDRERLPPCAIYPDRFGLPEKKAAKWYYDNLPKSMAKNCDAAGGGQALGQIKQSHSAWKGAKDDPIYKDYIKGVLRKAMELCDNNYGDVPGDLIETIRQQTQLRKPIVPWERLFRLACTSALADVLGYTIKRISKRFDTRPGVRLGEKLNVAVIIDTSGSISMRQLEMFRNEVVWMWRTGSDIMVYEADTKVARSYPFKGHFDTKVHGRGGTNLEPALAEVEGKYDLVIYFTDFYAPIIKRRYRVRMIWVLSTSLKPNQYPCKWGRHIRLPAA